MTHLQKPKSPSHNFLMNTWNQLHVDKDKIKIISPFFPFQAFQQKEIWRSVYILSI